MKYKSKNAPVSKGLLKGSAEKESQPTAWRKIGLRLAAIFLIIVFLASECASLIPIG